MNVQHGELVVAPPKATAGALMPDSRAKAVSAVAIRVAFSNVMTVLTVVVVMKKIHSRVFGSRTEETPLTSPSTRPRGVSVRPSTR